MNSWKNQSGSDWTMLPLRKLYGELVNFEYDIGQAARANIRARQDRRQSYWLLAFLGVFFCSVFLIALMASNGLIGSAPSKPPLGGYMDQLATSFYLIAMVIPVAKVLQRTGFSTWWMLLFLVPVINVVGMWIFAFGKWPIDKRRDG